MSDPPSAGWYPDPTQAETQRYWTGAEWTEQRAPLAKAKRTDQDLTFGVLLGIAIPIVGVLYGFVMLLRGNGNGGWVIVASILASIVWAVVIAFFVGFASA